MSKTCLRHEGRGILAACSAKCAPDTTPFSLRVLGVVLMGAPRKRERLLVVGAGMAGLKLVEEVVELSPGRYDIAMIGAETHPAYNRVLLSSLLAGDAAE